MIAQRDITVSKVDLYGVPQQDVEALGSDALGVTLPKGIQNVSMTKGASIERLSARTFNANNLVVAKKEEDARWTFEVPAESVETFKKHIDDILMVCHYTVS